MRTIVKPAFLLAGMSISLLAQVDRVPAGSEIVVRTNETVDARHPSDSRIYSAVVERDVMDRSGKVVIPRGADAELIMRDADNDEIIVDLESVTVGGRRYAVNASSETLSTEGQRKDGVGVNERTGKYVGGGALLGTIVGAIAGGGKGAAIGAAAGAGAGAIGQTVTRGGRVQLPAESLVTFRLNQPLRMGVSDSGYMREGRHYHRYGTERSRTR
jgi:hypothetical protein